MPTIKDTSKRKRKRGAAPALPEEFTPLMLGGSRFFVVPEDTLYEWVEEQRDIIESKLLLKHEKESIVPFEEAVGRIRRQRK